MPGSNTMFDIDALPRVAAQRPLAGAAAGMRFTFMGQQGVLTLGLTRDVGEDPLLPRARARNYCCAVAGRVRPPATRLPPMTSRFHQMAVRDAAPVPCASSPGNCPVV